MDKHKPKPKHASDSNRNVLRLPWKNFALRAQNVGRNNKNAVILQMTVLVNQDGNPALWTEPKVISLEPRLDLDINALLNKQLTGEEMLALLEVVASGR